MRILFALLILIACPLSAQENGAAESATETETTENTTLILHTSLGSITIELFEDKAPKSSANFLEYADRKSTRLNSSHVAISYAVFCLKKKNTHSRQAQHTPA